MTTTAPTTSMLRRALAVAAVAAVGLVGCTEPDTPTKGKPDVQPMSEADMTRQVQDLAEQVRAATGAARLLNGRASSAPCDTDGGDTSEQVRYVQGSYNLSVPATAHASTFRTVRDQWQAAGWTIDDYRVPENGDGIMSAKGPGQVSSFTLTTAKAPDTLGLIIQTDCYRDESYG